jgi:ubiquinone/menaquinone biosynthesis C-methylase UbiE
MYLQAMVELLLAVGLAVAASFYALNQVRKPSGLVGRLLLWIMNVSHRGVTDWGLKHVQIEEQFTILDVGCGGGRTVEKLSALAPKGMVYGVDYSKGSVDASRATNSQLIQAGRVAIEQASVSQLPFAESTFNLVTAVETQYFWPDLVNDMREILRVLKPGGTLIVIAESYKKGKHDSLQAPVMKVVRSASLSVDEERGLFSAAGYSDIQVSEERSKGWMCATGRKPSAISAPD